MYSIEKLENGFEYILLRNRVASTKIALQGAHIFSYVREGEQDLLWMSKESAFENGVAIRGGIPLCWPRFGSLDTSLPQHGFARTSLFKLVSVNEEEELSVVTLRLQESEQSMAIWNFSFELRVTISVGKELKISMSTTNTNEEELYITQAFHTYFWISDIENILIEGLDGCNYIDTLKDKKEQQDNELYINAETDRVYCNTPAKLLLQDKRRVVKLKSKGSASTVVWNPWVQKGNSMSYMHQNGYREFICIETANAFDDYVIIKPQKNYTLELLVSF